MSALASTLIYLMAIGTVVLDATLIIKVLMLLYPASRARLVDREQRYGLLAIFILSTLAVLGTLVMQYMAGLAPCLFCWWQRVFMYPIPFIALIAIIKNQKISAVADYILTLSLVGLAIALYQHLLQVLPSGALIPCDATDDCAVRSVFEFGFVTIPWMAASAFAVIALIALLARRAE